MLSDEFNRRVESLERKIDEMIITTTANHGFGGDNGHVIIDDYGTIVTLNKK